MNKFESFCHNIGYKFKNYNLLKLALMHRSCGENHNERLEFLGDSIVNFVIAEILFLKFSNASEGNLTRLRSTLVNRNYLAKLARNFDLGNFLSLGMGEIKTGGRNRDSILSCAMEAVIGAIYLDSDFLKVKFVISTWYDKALSDMPTAIDLKDPKTQLQELLQARGMDLPKYKIDSISGQSHCQIFSISCIVNKTKIVANGLSRRKAEQEAAALMLEKIFNERKS